MAANGVGKVAVIGSTGAGVGSFVAAAGDLQLLSLPGWEVSRRSVGGRMVYLVGVTDPYRWLSAQAYAGAQAALLVVRPGCGTDVFSDLAHVPQAAYAVVLNTFGQSRRHARDVLAARAALRLPADVPLVACDVRDRGQAATACDTALRALAGQCTAPILRALTAR